MIEPIPYGTLNQWLACHHLPEGRGWSFRVECPDRDDDRTLFSAVIARRWAAEHGGKVYVVETAAPAAVLADRPDDYQPVAAPDRVSAVLARRARSADWLAAHPLSSGAQMIYQVVCPNSLNNRFTVDRRYAMRKARQHQGVVHPAAVQIFDDVLEPEPGDFDSLLPEQVDCCRRAIADVGLPLDMPAKQVGEVLRSYGYKFRSAVIGEAVRQRRGRPASRQQVSRHSSTVAGCLDAMAEVGLAPGVSVRPAKAALRGAGHRFRNATIQAAVRQWKTSLAGPQPGEKVA